MEEEKIKKRKEKLKKMQEEGIDLVEREKESYYPGGSFMCKPCIKKAKGKRNTIDRKQEYLQSSPDVNISSASPNI